MKNLGSLALVAILCSFAQPASAWLKVCNNSSRELWYTQATTDLQCDWPGVRSSGWWNIKPGACATTSSKSMSNDSFQYYAKTADPNVFWAGAQKLCTTYELHNWCQAYPDRGGCRSNEVLIGFRSKNTSSTNFTLNLTN
jgi:uncharacterized membrane protein